ncbi:MAG TPA: WbqC family protein [Anaerolineaceae bacterium]|nr:WbqC family protein [Anaerolineaceae bacterium]
MKCVILQPSYIPWRGYFHQIYKADLFIFYDDVKYDKNGWRNRNRIKTANGVHWLTIPVRTPNLESNQTPICAVRPDWSRPWNQIHWETIRQAYCKAPYFHLYADWLEEIYRTRPIYLADFTIQLTVALTRALGIQHTQFMRSSEIENLHGAKTERLIELLTRIGATHYISGPSAKDYIQPELFNQAGISLEYMAYNYPDYPQLHPPFDPQVTILDLLFMTGPEALKYILDDDEQRRAAIAPER